MSQIGHFYAYGEQQCIDDRFADIGGNAIIYRYPNGCTDIICASDKHFRPPGWESAEDFGRPGREGPAPAARVKGKKSEGDDLLRSMRRARAKLRRLALSNEFQYFVTLTLAPEKIDRYNGAAVTRALSQWCDNMVRRHGLRYILVPERHEDGAFHFHGFFAGEGLQVVDSGTVSMAGWRKPPARAAKRSGLSGLPQAGALCTTCRSGNWDSPQLPCCMANMAQRWRTAASMWESSRGNGPWAAGIIPAEHWRSRKRCTLPSTIGDLLKILEIMRWNWIFPAVNCW